MSEQPRRRALQVGASVRVKKGVRDEDNADWSIEDWEGRVVEISTGTTPPYVLVDWDSITLNRMPAEMIEACEEEGLDWSQYGLDPGDVEVVPPRDRVQDVEEAKDRLQTVHGWASLGEEGRRIRNVLAGARSDGVFDILHAWETYLAEHLAFPFEAVVQEYQEAGVLRQGNRVRIFGISDTDDLYGLIARVSYHGRRYHFPLCDLEARDTASTNHQPLQDYCVWFANQ